MSDTYRRFLVIAGSGIGNILLATPVIRSLRAGYPGAAIDVLVPQGRGGILAGNPDVRQIVEVPRRQGLRASIDFAARMWRRYDLAVSAQAGDRSLVSAWVAAPVRYSHVGTGSGTHPWVRLAIQHRVSADSSTHAVIHGLRLLDPLRIERQYALAPPACAVAGRQALDRLLNFSRDRDRYAVVHPYPRNRYKCWTAEGWRTVLRHVGGQGLFVVVTGGSATDEQRHLREILAGGAFPRVVDLSGRLDLSQVSDLLSRASLFVGPDTGVTHLAAAQGIPCIALYGPTDPVYWGPWPHGYAEDASPFRRRGSQRCRNVALLQHEGDCVACGREGCTDDPTASSECMRRLEAGQVLRAMDESLSQA
jgi:heptosyltransferase-3